MPVCVVRLVVLPWVWIQVNAEQHNSNVCWCWWVIIIDSKIYWNQRTKRQYSDGFADQMFHNYKMQTSTIRSDSGRHILIFNILCIEFGDHNAYPFTLCTYRSAPKETSIWSSRIKIYGHWTMSMHAPCVLSKRFETLSRSTISIRINIERLLWMQFESSSFDSHTHTLDRYRNASQSIAEFGKCQMINICSWINKLLGNIGVFRDSRWPTVSARNTHTQLWCIMYTTKSFRENWRQHYQSLQSENLNPKPAQPSEFVDNERIGNGMRLYCCCVV